MCPSPLSPLVFFRLDRSLPSCLFSFPSLSAVKGEKAVFFSHHESSTVRNWGVTSVLSPGQDMARGKNLKTAECIALDNWDNVQLFTAVSLSFDN